jgi:hypothetical protein
MATWNTPLYTSQIPAAGASEAVNYPLAKIARGKLRIVRAVYTLVNTEAANDLIQLTMLQPGDRVLPEYSKIVSENPGTTLTLQIGDSVTANRYSGTLTLSNTTLDAFWSSSLGATSGASVFASADITVPAYTGATPPQPVPPANATDQTIVIAKILSAAALTAGKRIVFDIAIVGE